MELELAGTADIVDELRRRGAPFALIAFASNNQTDNVHVAFNADPDTLIPILGTIERLKFGMLRTFDCSPVEEDEEEGEDWHE